tara:strand:- start:415 stop:1404 length:990 start_codon:yes stop_codon:yes gene_type:complete
MAYIIAEIGNTHEGSLGLAKKFAESASNSGADAIKFQTHIFNAESTKRAPNPPYFSDETREEYFNRTSFTKDEWTDLRLFIEDNLKKDFISSPFSLEAIDLLESVGIKKYKIPSGEITNIPLLEKVAKTGKEVIISSGMSTLNELDNAVSIFNKEKLILLQCTSEYPCPPEKAGLNLINFFYERYKIPIGFSDHTDSISIPIGAVTLGAKVIEKHFTLSKEMYGSDAKNSFEPKEFKFLVDEIRKLEKTLKFKLNKNNLDKKIEAMRYTFQKSIVASKDLKKGQKIEIQDLAYKKPGDGLAPEFYKELIGKILKKDIMKDDIIKFEELK